MGNEISREVLEKMNTAEGRKWFIDNYESSVYAGKNVDGEEVIVMNEQRSGMEIWTKRKGKPNWYEIAGHDADGYQESVTYRSVRDTKDKA